MSQSTPQATCLFNTANQAQNPQQLMAAFEQFSRISEQLQQSYQELDQRAQLLTDELATARDERLKQLAEKEKLADRLEKLLSAMPAGVVVINDLNIIQTANTAAEIFFEQNLKGKDWSHIMSVAIQAQHEQDVILKNGRILNLTQTQLDANEGEMILMNDVSQQRSLQTTAARQNRLAAMGEMAAGLAHQLRTPLSSAVLYASQIDQANLNFAQQQKASSKIRTSLRYLEKLINDMLMYAKGGEFGDTSFTLNQFLVSFNSRIEARLLQHNASLSIKSTLDDYSLKGSQNALVSVLCNLAENAIEACSDQCEMELNVYFNQQYLVLSLKDNGPGLNVQQQKEVFEPFYSQREGGTGLGLAVAKSIVQAHRGELFVESKESQGCTFYMCLPLEQGEYFLASGRAVNLQNENQKFEANV